MSAQGLGSRAILGRLYLRLQQGVAGWVDRLSFPVTSDQASEEHRWLGMSPVMREWIGGRLVHGLRESGIVIANVKYEATVGVMLDEIRRDKTGQVMARINEMADRANSHGAKLLSSLIIAAESTVCYDGQYFFDTDHSEGDSGAQSNDISVDISTLPVASHGSTTAPAVDEMAQAILLGIQQMLGFKDDQGEPLNEAAQEFLVMVPTSLWAVAVAATSNAILTSGQINPLVANSNLRVSVVGNPRLTWTDKFAIFRADQGDGVKPFIKQEEKPLTVSAQAEGTPEEFNNDRHVYGIDWTGAFGLGFWQHACLVTMT